MKTTLIRSRFIPDVHAPATDRLNGHWQTGWQIPGAPATAFFCLGKWWAIKETDPSVTEETNPVVTGPFSNKTAALNA